MRLKLILVSLLVAVTTITTRSATRIDGNPAQVLKVVKYEQLKAVIEKKGNKLYVVNFWATWCGPCVKELPDFMEVNARYGSNPKFKMVLVSLDNVKDFDRTVKPFIKNHNITTDVYLLDDNKRMNMWIPAVDKSWGGVIPATVIYKNGKKLHFIEGQTDKRELDKLITKYL